jgi:Family of unknown function (DUF5804)
VKILLVPRPGVDLYRTLYDSETSRAILRFYKPSRHPWGVEITVSSLGSAVSLISELRWYLQRYIQEVLIEVADGVIISRALAREVYQRDLVLTSPWPHRMRFRMERGRIRRSLVEPEAAPSAQTPGPEPVPVPSAPEQSSSPRMSESVPAAGSPEPGAVPGGSDPHPVSMPESGPGPASPAPVPPSGTPEPVVPPSPQPPPVHAPVSPEAITIEVWTTPDEPVEDVVAEEEPPVAEGEAGGEPPEASGEKGEDGD